MPNFTIPEAEETLKEQIKSLKEGRVKTVLITPGEKIPEYPKRMKLLDTEVGKWIYDPLKIKGSKIEKMVKDGTYYILLGHVEPKSTMTTITVTIEKNGSELKSSQTSPRNAQKQAQELKKQFPRGKVSIGGQEKAKDVLERRLTDLEKHEEEETEE